MKRELLLTKDGSHTIAIPGMNVTYHSTHGAIQESMHVFIQAGLKNIPTENIRIFEMGFGTGLNALLTWQYATANNKKIYYYSVEQFPLTIKEAEGLNYDATFTTQLHTAAWDKDVELDTHFTLHKSHSSLLTSVPTTTFHLIYFDAFAPDVQPELWTQSVFEKLYTLLEPGGIFVTYCCKGIVRRAMQAAGFKTEKLPGPPGKREILRAHTI
jgi:tRNA U34 5-methylaminomethyl-2-thiouridine-forming methyltransferase MnmC